MQTQDQLAQAAKALAPQVVALVNKTLLEATYTPQQAHAALYQGHKKSVTRIYLSGKKAAGYLELRGHEWVLAEPSRFTMLDGVLTETAAKVNQFFLRKMQA